MASLTDAVAEGSALPGDAQKFHAARVVTLASGHFIHDTYISFLSPLLPMFIANLALSKTEAGILVIFTQWPSVLQPILGNLADRVNLRAFVILAPAVTGVAMSLLGIAPTYAILALLLVVAGLSSAAFHAVGPAHVGVLSGRNLGRGVGIWMVGGEFGYTVGPLLISSAVKFLTPKGTPWLMILGLLSSLFLYAKLRDVPGLQPRGAQSRPWRQALRKMKPALGPLIGITLARSFMIAGLTTFLPVFMREQGAELWLAGVSLSVLQVAAVGGSLAIGALSDSLGRKSTVALSLLLGSLSTLLFITVEGWVRFPVLLLVGFTGLCTPVVLLALVQETFPENRALAVGIYNAITFVIYAATVAVMGALGDWVGLRTAFMVSAAVTLLGLPVVPLLPGGRKRNAAKGIEA